MKGFLSKPAVKQLIAFFFVGCASSVVEWVVFAILSLLFDIQYLLATVLAVICSTLVNWGLCRRFVFKEGTRFGDKLGKELLVIYLVSFGGMLANLGLMWVFVEICGLSDGVKKVAAKMIATAIVSSCNYVVKKFLVYL